MRLSQLFGVTLRQPPADVHLEGLALLLRAGFFKQGTTGLTALPLGKRVIMRVQSQLREMLVVLGGQEIGAQKVPEDDAPSYVRRLRLLEELHALSKGILTSHRNFPRLIFRFAREARLSTPSPWHWQQFTSLDIFSLAGEVEAAHRQQAAVWSVLLNYFSQNGLNLSAPWLASYEDGSAEQAALFPVKNGSMEILHCVSCGTAARTVNLRPVVAVGAEEAMRPMEKVATPHAGTIAELADFLELPASRTSKAVFLTDGERLVFAVVRGDCDVDESKLMRAIGSWQLVPATDEAIRQAGAVPGYASPVGLHGQALVVVDTAIPNSPNLAAGANEEGFHLLNVNYGRDYQADLVADIALAKAGTACPQCGAAMQSALGIELAHAALFDGNSIHPAGWTYNDANQHTQPVWAGVTRMGLERMLMAVAEVRHDEWGLIWPAEIAPFDVHLVSLRGGEAQAERLYASWRAFGRQVLFDDREASPGVKFKDADLIGVPLRVTVSKRSLEAGGAEVKKRAHKQSEIVAIDEIEKRFRF